MAKSFIALAEDREIRGIFVYWEPYVNNTAQILLEHYQNKDKVLELLLLGDILFLERDVRDIQKPIGNLSELTTYPSISSMIKNSWIEHHADYCYTYLGGRWMGFSSNPKLPGSDAFDLIDSDCEDLYSILDRDYL
jgi:hypothetical protein